MATSEAEPSSLTEPLKITLEMQVNQKDSIELEVSPNKKISFEL